jgi:hypothetical protein
MCKKLNQFTTSILTTTYDSINKIWLILGTFKNGSQFHLNNIQVTVLFYNGNGNALGNNLIINNVFPNILNTFEDGTFSFNVFVNNDLNGINHLYIVLSYNQQQDLNLIFFDMLNLNYIIKLTLTNLGI